jgi:predicted nucleic acid-binding protein
MAIYEVSMKVIERTKMVECDKYTSKENLMRVMVYINTNVFCRPFDDQGQKRVLLETEAFITILTWINEGKLELLSSQTLDAEISNIDDPAKREYALDMLEVYTTKYVTLDQHILTLSGRIHRKYCVDPIDAQHLASACLGGAAYLITCDDELWRIKASVIKRHILKEGFKLKVMNPIEFVEAFKGG